jgi:hypothetical protein
MSVFRLSCLDIAAPIVRFGQWLFASLSSMPLPLAGRHSAISDCTPIDLDLLRTGSP